MSAYYERFTVDQKYDLYSFVNLGTPRTCFCVLLHCSVYSRLYWLFHYLYVCM